MKIKKTRLIQIIREEISSYRKENLKEISGLATAARGAKQKGYVSPKTKKAISKSIDVLKGLAKRSVAGFLKFLGILPPDVSYKIKF